MDFFHRYQALKILGRAHIKGRYIFSILVRIPCIHRKLFLKTASIKGKIYHIDDRAFLYLQKGRDY